jgi:hypothetical protein
MPILLLRWQRHRTLRAARNDDLFVQSPDLVSRQSPRLAAGARSICAHLDSVRRQKKPQKLRTRCHCDKSDTSK